jgi:short-subunit dehydrogenase
VGCNVAVVDIDKDAADQTAKEVSLIGVQARSYKVDVASAEQIVTLRDELSCTLGAVDILVKTMVEF